MLFDISHSYQFPSHQPVEVFLTWKLVECRTKIVYSIFLAGLGNFYRLLLEASPGSLYFLIL